MAPYSFLVLSIVLQVVAAVLALRLIPASGVRLPWILICAALIVRIFRQGTSLWLGLAKNFHLSTFEEGLGLTTSVLLLLGTACIRPLFQQWQAAAAEREELLEKARQARRRSDEEQLRLRAVIDHLPVGVFVIEADGRIAEVNEAVHRIWGGEAPLSGSIPEYGEYKGWWVDSGERVKAEEWGAARALSRGETSLAEAIDIERRDGTRGTILNSAVPIRSPDGEIVGAVAVNQDITQLRQLQRELEDGHRQTRRYAAELEAIFQAMPDGLIIYDQDGRIVRSNERAEELTGFDAEGHRLPIQERWNRVRVEHPEGTRLQFRDIPSARAMEGEEVRGAVLVFRPEENRRVVVSLNSAPIRLEGEIIGVASTISDITHLHDLQEQHQVFVQMLSHDLRTPLTVVQGYAEFLDQTVTGEQEQTITKSILAACFKMTSMLEDLVDMARLEHGHIALLVEPIAPAPFVADFLQRQAMAFDTKRVRLSLPAELPLVQADVTALERVFANLLTNALKYSTAAVRISACRRGDEVRFSVADRGRGIDGEDLPRIFDRFFRARGVSGTKGLGLGLYISRLLIEAHGGRIWAHSAPDKGTVFFFTLPIR